MFRIFIYAFDGTYNHALRFIEMPYALGAAAGVDDVDILPLRNGLVGASRFADIAIDAQLIDFKRHSLRRNGLAFAKPSLLVW